MREIFQILDSLLFFAGIALDEGAFSPLPPFALVFPVPRHAPAWAGERMGVRKPARRRRQAQPAARGERLGRRNRRNKSVREANPAASAGFLLPGKLRAARLPPFTESAAGGATSASEPTFPRDLAGGSRPPRHAAPASPRDTPPRERVFLAPPFPRANSPARGSFSLSRESHTKKPTDEKSVGWSEWRDSNSRPRHPKCRALPSGLHPDTLHLAPLRPRFPSRPRPRLALRTREEMVPPPRPRAYPWR